jgi:flagellar biosynthetic protein FlhB
MAKENADGQEKTEEPSGKRLDDAREKGQVARSRELNNVAMSMVGFLTLMVLMNHFGNGIWGITHANFELTRADLFDDMAMIRHFTDAIVQALLLLLPFLAVMVVVAIGSSIALSGFVFSTKALGVKFSKLNPVSGLKRMFSAKTLVELFKSLMKFFLIAGLALIILRMTFDRYLALASLDLVPALVEMNSMLGWSVFLLTAALILVALVDVPYQLWDFKQNLRMTKQEVKDEYKQTEGDPKVKGRIRRLQMEAAARRMMEAVPQADVIVTNPTHYAVAIKYDQLRMNAPQVLAKGVDAIAMNIRKVAEEHKVPIIEAPMLARALYFNTEIGDSIPKGLYLAVAKLLAYVFQLRMWQKGMSRPRAPGEYPIPEEFRTPDQA